MKKFILKISVLIFQLLIFQTIIIMMFFFINVKPKIYSNEKEIPNPSKKYIYIMGNSHPQCAINDKLLPPKFFNISNSSEPLFYTCSRARYLLEEYRNDSIVIEFTNISPMTIDWVVGDNHFVRNLQNKLFIVDGFQKHYLIRKNKIKFLKSILSISLLDLFNKNVIKGGYLHLQRNEIVQKISNFKNRWLPTKDNYYAYSFNDRNTNYTELIRLIRDFPQTHFIIIRSPMHSSFDFFQETDYQENVKGIKANPNVSYFDMSNTVTNDKYFGDAEHLNYLGANFFTPLFLNRIRSISSKSNQTHQGSN